MTVREDETVTIPPGGIAWVVLEEIPPQHLGDVGHPHWCARMPGRRLLNSIHGERPDRIGKLAAARGALHRFHGRDRASARFWLGARRSRYVNVDSLPRTVPSGLRRERAVAPLASQLGPRNRCRGPVHINLPLE